MIYIFLPVRLRIVSVRDKPHQEQLGMDFFCKHYYAIQAEQFKTKIEQLKQAVSS
jgi:hypothetical protein